MKLETALLAVGVAGLTLVLSSFAQSNSPAQEPGARVDVDLEFLKSPASLLSSLPNLTRGADGKVYLSWVEHSGEGEALFKVVPFDGDEWGEPREVLRAADLFLNWADFPSISANKDGALLAHWLRKGTAHHAYDAEFSLSSDGGLSWSAPKCLHEDRRPAEHGFVSIAPLENGDFGAIWLDGRSMADAHADPKEMALYYRSISASGDLGPEQVLDSRVCDCCQTSLVASPNGNLLAAYRDRGPTEIRDMSFVSFDGKRWSKPAVIHEDGWLIEGCPVNGPALVSTPTSSAALWFTGAGEEGGRVNFATRAADSAIFAPPMRLDNGSPIGRVDLVRSGDVLFATWLEHTEASFGEWRLQPLPASKNSATSRKPRSDFIAIDQVSGDRKSGFLRMAPIDGGCLLAWTSHDPEPQVRTGRVRVTP